MTWLIGETCCVAMGIAQIAWPAFLEGISKPDRQSLAVEVGRAILTGPPSLSENTDSVILDPQVVTDKLLEVLSRQPPPAEAWSFVSSG
ncbi:hypothetical protein H4P1_00073 (plasmid) [Variovorax sp. PBS-H4]|nr:hypothetical protein H4P1_00073 [Variovorax sp. PBS-H4]